MRYNNPTISFCLRNTGSMKYSFKILNNITSDPLLASFLNWKEKGSEESFSQFLYQLYQNNAQDNFSAYVKEVLFYDINPFSRACAEKKELSPYLLRAYASDLSLIHSLLASTNGKDLFCVGSSFSEIGRAPSEAIKKFRAHYEQYGYGDFMRYSAFSYENKELRPILAPSAVRLSALKDYEKEKKLIADNIENFLGELPHANMLLYGERGTGKSSTVHAMLNEYWERGLRLVELSRDSLCDLVALKELLRFVPLHFMIYIDDFSLNAGDERISALKAALEGCMQGNADNTMIVATSNRRHIVDEKFSLREDSVHANDSMQEELSLADRFGLSILFSATDKSGYLSIVRQLAADYGLNLPVEELELLAERWAVQKGGRSPRRAKQFIDFIYSMNKRGAKITF